MFLASVVVLFAAVPTLPTPLEARVDAVTVFRTQALVVRRADAALAGPRRLHALAIPNLPAALDESTAQLRCEGSARPSISGFSLQDVPGAAGAAPAKELAAIAEAERLLLRQDRVHADALATLDVRRNFLNALRDAYLRRIARENGDTDLSDLSQESQGLVVRGLEAVASEQRELERRRQDLAAELQALRVRAQAL